MVPGRFIHADRKRSSQHREIVFAMALRYDMDLQDKPGGVMSLQAQTRNNQPLPREPIQAKTMRFQPFRGTRQAALTDIPVNVNQDNVNHVSDGLIKKIRKSSVSGKPKEPKKIPLVSNHKQVAFKPTGFKRTRSEKNIKVPVPEQAVQFDHDPELSPMDIDAPLVRVRNLMKKVPRGVPDIDAINDPLKCSLYAQDICDYLQAVESRFVFPKNYLYHQREVTQHMRSVLIDWIIQVQVHQELSQNTLHLCVALIDRFLTRAIVPMSKLQLMGVTALLVAAKYFERFPPEIPDLCHLTDGTYQPEEILQMEIQLLLRLKWDLNIPCPMVFLDRFLMVKPCDNTHLIKSMALYFLDLSLIDDSFVYFPSSLKAAAAIYVSRELIGCDVLWDKAFSHYTKYSENDLQICARAMRKLMAMAKKSPHTGAHTKYCHSNFHGVSNHRSLMHLSCHPTTLWPSEDQKDGQQLEMII